MDSKPQEMQSVPPQYISAYPVDDEISLVDIWIAFARYKKLLIGSFISILILGILVVSLLLNEKYRMSSVISPGTVTVGGDRAPIEPPAAIVAELERSVMPELTTKYAEKYGFDLFETSINNPRGTDLVIIENRVNEDNRDVIAEFQQEIVSRITDSHLKLFDARNAGLKRQIAQENKLLTELVHPLKLDKLTENQRLALQVENQALAKLTDEAVRESNLQAIRDKIKIAEDNIQALTQQNDALLEQVSTAENSGIGKDKGDVRINISENRLAINSSQNQLINLKQSLERFDIELEQQIVNKRTEIQSIETTIKLISDDLNDRIALQKEKIRDLKLQLENDVTRATAVAELSLRPAGLTKLKALVLVFVLSLFAAFAITLVAIFREKVRERISEGR